MRATDDKTPPPVPTTPPPPAPPGFFYEWLGWLPDGTPVEFGNLISMKEFDAKCDAEAAAQWAALTDEERAEELAREAAEDAEMEELDRIIEEEQAWLASLPPEERAREAARLAAEAEEFIARARAEDAAKAQPKPKKKKRRGKLSPLAKKLAPVARRLMKSPHKFLQLDGAVIDFLIDGERPSTPLTEQVICRVMEALGRTLPGEHWLAVGELVAPSLSEYFRDAALAERARVAFENGQRGKKKWKGKKQAKVADDLARGREILEQLRGAAMRK